jgi:hypothetical protein
VFPLGWPLNAAGMAQKPGPKMQGFESISEPRILDTPRPPPATVTTMTRIVAIIAAAVFLTGCGNSDPAPTSTPTPAAASLADTCPLLEQATPAGMLPSRARLAEYADDLQALADAGDVETRNAIAVMQDAVTQLQTAEPGADYTAAFDTMTNALRTIATRCGAVGSSAFQ